MRAAARALAGVPAMHHAPAPHGAGRRAPAARPARKVKGRHMHKHELAGGCPNTHLRLVVQAGERLQPGQHVRAAAHDARGRPHCAPPAARAWRPPTRARSPAGAPARPSLRSRQSEMPFRTLSIRQITIWVARSKAHGATVHQHRGDMRLSRQLRRVRYSLPCTGRALGHKQTPNPDTTSIPYMQLENPQEHTCEVGALRGERELAPGVAARRPRRARGWAPTARAANTRPSSSELLARRLAPCRPVHATSPAANRPGMLVSPHSPVCAQPGTPDVRQGGSQLDNL